ncbi:hypothetical protein HOO68_02800 [Candidatus Gracilibacteria bacterium]|nr:hypothetical protein [Candidatus Gracilibacteria bacterium]
MLSQNNSPSNIEASTISILVRGSGTSPISLENLEKHFRVVDPTSWKIISHRFAQSSREKIAKILLQVTQTPGIQYSTQSLIRMLLTLPNEEKIEDKLSIN